MTATIGLETVLVRDDKNFLANPVGEEMVVMDMKSGNYIGLNPVGAHIWKLLETPQPVTAIIANLMGTYEVDEDTCRSQTLEYLDKMASQGLVRTQAR
ncbi:MAG: PqqD family protein [Sphingobacteriales bacterium]|nr:MAG: PqqD family protein [Sphingobacteriales bacterium]